MPKAILKFNLPEENDEFNAAVNAVKVLCGIFEYKSWLRSKIKYDDSLTDEQIEIFEKCMQELVDNLGESIE